MIFRSVSSFTPACRTFGTNAVKLFPYPGRTNVTADDASAAPITVILNWAGALRK